MVDSTTAAAVLTAVFLVVWGLTWRSLARARRQVARLQAQLATVELERIVRPSLRVTFEFNATTREALVHVTNDGGDATVSAAMSVEGALAHRIDQGFRAVWREGTSATVLLGSGQTRTLRLAQLDISVFPYAQWSIFGLDTDSSVVTVRATHTSMIGGDPATRAPAIFLQVALLTKPEAAGPPAHCTIALQPFDAVRLRPL